MCRLIDIRGLLLLLLMIAVTGRPCADVAKGQGQPDRHSLLRRSRTTNIVHNKTCTRVNTSVVDSVC